MNNGLLLLLIVLTMGPTVIITTVIPLLTRKIESFGVTIPEAGQKHPEISALRRQYLWWNGGLGLAVIVSLLLLTRGIEDGQAGGWLFSGHILGYIVLSFAIYLKQHFAVKRLKHREGWATEAVQRTVVNVKFRNEKLTYSNFWFIPHVLLIMATVLVGVLYYDQFPDVIPMQYGFDGEITRSVGKSYTTVLWPAMVQAFLLVTFVFINYGIGQSKQIVESSDPEGSLKRNVKFRRYWSAYMIVFGFLIMAVFDLFLLSMLLHWSPNTTSAVTLSVIGAILIGSIVLSLVTGQGGSRIKLGGGTAPATVQTADQDRYWKLGIFYFNPQDPALFVEKRFGVGWTMNFARPVVWVVLFLLLAAPLAISLFQ